jgi:hypothetical protein
VALPLSSSAEVPAVITADQHGEAPGERLRAALAARDAQQSAQRARRAVRLARLATPEDRPDLPREVCEAVKGRETHDSLMRGEACNALARGVGLRDAEALESFLAALIGALDGEAPRAAPAEALAAEVVPIDRSAAPAEAEGGEALGRVFPFGVADRVSPPAAAWPVRPPGDAAELACLPGAGPGLVGALIRAGVPDLTTLAALGRDDLAARLGPLARLIDLDAWIARAEAETATRR